MMLYVTVLAKPALFTPKLNSILLPQFTDTLNIYPFPVYQVLNVNWSAFLKDISPTIQSHCQNNGIHMEGTNWAVGTGFALTDYVAHWHVIGHCVDVMAAHGCSKRQFLLPPTPPRPTHPLLAILMAEGDSKKYHDIQHLEIEKVSYNKNQVLYCSTHRHNTKLRSSFCK